MGFSLWMSGRLKLNGNKGGANATGVAIAVTGVALALIIMEFTIAIVLGFKHQITGMVTGFEGKLWVLPDYNYNLASSAATITPDSTLTAMISEVLPGADTYMRFNQPGILKTDTDFAGVYFTGNDPEHDTVFERGCIVSGEYPDFTDSINHDKIVISKMSATTLGLDTGDKINACFFINGAIKSRRFEIAGIYETGFGDFDRTVVYTSINTLRRIASAEAGSGTRLMIEPTSQDHLQEDAASLQDKIIESYGNGSADKLYPVDNVRHTGAIYFNWLELLNTNVVVIFILMTCVSGFTLVSSMFILILERIQTIGILRSLGATKRQVRRIFILLTLKIVGAGLLAGNIAGLGMLYVQDRWHPLTLDADMYYLKYVPVEFNWPYIAALNAGIFVVSWLILVLPSRMASGISPAVTMRFE